MTDAHSPDYLRMLSRIELFARLPADQLERLAQRLEYRTILRGEYLVHQGEAADHLYLVVQGRFEVLRDGVRRVAELGAGQPIGEIAFFAGETRTADVRAARDSDVLVLTRATFDALVAEVPMFNQVLLAALGSRLAVASATAPALKAQPPRHIGLCMAGPTPPPASFIDTLCEVLGSLEDVVFVHQGTLPPGLDPARDNLHEWLAAQERSCQRLVSITGRGNEAFDRAVLRHCDALLLIGEAGQAGRGAVPPNPLESYACALLDPRDVSLALWRERASQPITATRDWLEGRSVHLHHHVALDQGGDIQRLARFLTGRARGMVFGGGGALGAGHFGVMRALLEAGATFDLFGGTSVGSSVTVEFASGRDPATFVEAFEHFFLRRRAFSRLTVPRFGLFDHHHFDRELQRRYGELTLEDCPFNAFAISANLTRGETEQHRFGPAWEAIRASCSIPAAVAPFVKEDGDVLVDGGILNNVPLGPMRALNPGTNVAISLSSGAPVRATQPYASLPGRYRLLGQVLARRARDESFPGVIEIVAESMTVTSRRTLTQLNLAPDVLLQPPAVAGMSILDWRRTREQEAAAYAWTQAQLDAVGSVEALLSAPPKA
ncbi:cyclic nucleotide-binding and patatin-like phospholipase domain-containing protein [Halomonas sp. PAMB 3264]|uniref:cyclic nucleotide-binding and patatin-like phospholipase domain-containing protein n=1 Tax=Halomonas sp. PAMB 3264 TaxID=3075222 RepID=UPI00289B80F4|nr:cyclic nucleotide-binding and patatin-like phospholipase domain-containing protein [Halomonas sp. PAMB 3264]WNL42984.1 cyclic nucleotide-binding and patatin-like phospholipase domain-containing protein [Halomonas sp. PAMB 3264]